MPILYALNSRKQCCLHVAWRQAITEVDGALGLVELAGPGFTSGRGVDLGNLLGVGGDQAHFGGTGDHLDMDVVLAGEE